MTQTSLAARHQTVTDEAELLLARASAGASLDLIRIVKYSWCMRHNHWRAIIAAALTIGLVWIAPSLGDVVTMKDGRVFEGLVKKQNAIILIIDTQIAGIRSTITLDRMQVESVDRSPLPDGFFGPTKQLPSDSPQSEQKSTSPAARKQTTKYMEIPLEGEFGVEIQPDGVREALSLAKRRGVKHIVLAIKSPGGRVDAAREIASIIAEHMDEFTFHALVEEGYSASIWVIFSCSDIFVKPGSAIGAAVALSQDESTGEIEVDAKVNSALSADVAGKAERNGHNPDIVRAMMLMNSVLFEWTDVDGVVNLGSQSPAGATASHQLDTAETVLTLTAAEAVRLRVARGIVENAKAIGNTIGLEGWEGDYRIGAAAMRRAREEAERKVKKREDRIKALPVEITSALSFVKASRDQAQRSDPRRSRYSHNYRTGRYTPDAQRKWRVQTDEAIHYWKTTFDGLRELRDLLSESDKLGFDLSALFDKDPLSIALPIEQEAKITIDWLKRNRNNIRK